MSLIAKATGGGTDFQTVEPGNYAARFIMCIDLGTQRQEYLGEVKNIPQLYLRWELQEFMEDNRPFIIGEFYTSSLGEKANLRKMLEGARGKVFTTEELAGFDVSKVLGTTCMVNVIHKKKQDGSNKVVVGAVTKIPKGMEVLPAHNPIVYFDIDHWDQQVFDALPKFLQEKIQQSAEYKLRGAKPDVPAVPTNTPAPDATVLEDTEDVPF